MVDAETLNYPSADGETTIRALAWLPEGAAAEAPRACVQIVHGMVEHVERYDDFARFLTSQGFAVCANDHIGHGESVADESRWGCLPWEGARVMVEDVHTLRGLFAGRFPEGTPYILFGHSMGSFVTRVYLARHGKGLAGAVVCGTGNPPVAVSRLGGWLARRIGAARGVDYRSKFLHGLADGAYSKKVENPRTDLDWLNSDPAGVDAYIADPACGAVFSCGGYASLMDLTAEAASNECAAAVPAGLPVLFVAGAQDPVGDCGAGVQAAADLMASQSTAQVQVKLYPGMRHEILNEPGHAEVYADVLTWLEGVLA